METTALQPKAVFDCFAQVNRIPRPSKREEKMIEFLKSFGERLGLPTKVDEAGNVLITKPATPGFENRRTVVLQSHMDMVCEKNADSAFDFMKDPIEAYVDGEWLKAKGTTLGADDGIGVAMQMALLEATDIPHGPIECLFTRDEETGLTGAAALKPGFMTGDYLINLDSEDEGQIFVSCAGGARTSAEFDFTEVPVPEGYFGFRVEVKGLTGGHSGDDINKKRANANKLLVRFILDAFKKYDLYLVDIQSGGLHNAIPREGFAVCAVPMADKEQVRVDLNLLAAAVEEEYSRTEPGVAFVLESAPVAGTAIDKDTTRRLLLALQAMDNGVFAMSQDLDWLVETSSNLASVRKEDGKVVINSSQRSSVASARENMSATVRAVFELAGARVVTNEGYPGWKMNPNSALLKVAVDSYRRLFSAEPKILAIHAGLECGLFSEKYPHLDMISVGPTLRGVHSPDERLHIPSVQKVWDHLLDMLVNIPTA
ncbi:MAG TPA: aminoacyl-histidine dipeptidase [Candidatus Caccomonas pullistercoris]|nr:aminoacyl-histidine dipeptidase [Candidatus Caccomonas pullistercoris]